MARPIMWLRHQQRANEAKQRLQDRNEEYRLEPVRQRLLNAADPNLARTFSDMSLNSTVIKPPPRSYRCQTDIASLPPLKYNVGSENEKNQTDRSLFVFSTNSLLRRSCKRIVETKTFEYLMLLTIAANCVVLMIATPLPNDDTSSLNQKLDQGDLVFVAAFALESSLKIIAFGFVFSKDAYLKSGWNILDFFVVVVGLIQVLTSLGNSNTAIRALRAVRVLRPLKLVSGVPSLQVLMKSLIKAMIPLLQILLLVLFVIIIYSIVGLELLRGRYHYTCFSNTTNRITDTGLKPHPCDSTNGWGRKCKEGDICKKAPLDVWPGPNNGITTFDNIFLSMLTVFQCITLEGWSEVLYLTMDSRDRQYPVLTWSAFILLIVVGSFFMLNLVLGVLSGEFAKERERVENRKSFLKLRKQRQVERTVDHYLHWISKAEDLFDEEDEDAFTDHDFPLEDTSKPSVHIDVQQQTVDKMSANAVARKKSRVVPPPRKRQMCHHIHKLEKRVKVHIRHLIKSKFFYWLVLLLVFLNTVSMSFNRHNQTQDMLNALEITELVFTSLFFLEMMLKIYGLGLRGYFHSAFNKYDFVIVWLSIADLLYKHICHNGNIGVSVLRSVRLLRIFKVTRFWSSMQNVISSLMNSIRSILSLILLLLLFIFIFALLGMQLFGGQFRSIPKGTPRANFDNFPKAMLAVFQIMTGEGWNAIMYRGISAFGGPKSVRGMLASLYFISLVILGNYTLLNVFLAIAVDNLANAQVLSKDEEEEMQRAEEQKKLINIMFSPVPIVKKPSKWNRVRTVPKLLMFPKLKKDTEKNPFKGITYKSRPVRARSESDSQASGAELFCNTVLQAKMKFRSLDLPDETPNKPRKLGIHSSSFDSSLSPHGALKNASALSTMSVAVNNNVQGDDKQHTPPPHILSLPGTGMEFQFNTKILRRRQLTTTKVINTRSLMIFSPSSRVRTWCHSLVNMKHFEHIMLFFILLSSLCLAIEDPLETQSNTNRILYYTDIGFVAIFAFEIVVKLIDQGAVLHKSAYLRDWWNVIDTIVVACNIAATVLMLDENEDIKGTIGESMLRAMRILRVFRPLRVVNKIKSLKLVFQCVVFSLKRVINIIIIAVLVLFMFAVIGVHLFKGKFQYCNDESKLTPVECQGIYYYVHDPIRYPSQFIVHERKWLNYAFHFDAVGQAMLTLFSCGTGEGWPIVMEKSIDATEINEGPVPDNNMFMSLYYVCFVVIFSFFFLNIFVALIIVTFQEQGEKEITGCEFDKNQRACLQFVLNAKPRQRFMPQDKTGFSYKMWCAVDSKPFEIVIMTLIASNAIVLMMSVDDQSSHILNILDNINLAFTFIFTFEAILKLMAYKLNYFRDSWNVFDFFIVFVTLVGAIINITSENFPIDPSFFRLFRAFRLLKLLRQGYNIRILLWTFLQSLQALPYVVLLIAMLFFIYAVIGMQLFSKVALNERRYINEYNNFQSFLKALGVLFRCGTGESWHLVMSDCFDHAPCLNDSTQQCGSSVAAIIYFCSFYFFYAFLLLNLFVAVIMDNFDYLTRDESILGPHHMDEFVRVWSEYDPSAAGRIPHGDIYQLMCDMQPPVGFGKKCPRFLAYKRLMKLNMPISGDNTVSFAPTLFALVRTSLGMTHKDKECFRDSSFRKIIKRVWPNTTQKMLDMLMPEQTVLSGQQITIGKIYAARLIYESFKETKRRKNCTLPQFEAFLENHKRGNSFFRKMMGALRTSSHPLGEKIIRPREEYLSKRRRSNTFGSTPTTENEDHSVRFRSTTNVSVNRTVESFSARIRKLTLPMHPMHNRPVDFTKTAQSLEVIPNVGTLQLPHQQQDIGKKDKNQGDVETSSRKSLTDTLITALQDPAKPILCFVNPQIHREDTRVPSSSMRYDSDSERDTNLERRSSYTRTRQKRVTVSLPMIHLEIPVEGDSEFIDIGQRASNQPTENDEDANVPDLIRYIHKSNHTAKPGGSSSTEDANCNPVRENSSLKTDPDDNEEDFSKSNRDLLRELNTHLNKAMSDGVQPHWIYKIKENEANTWC